MRALVDAQTPVVTLVAKSHTGHVERALRTTLDENLAMISDTVRFLVGEGRRVFLDAEHFFDGYHLNRDYALAALAAAAEAGAEVVALCDTNGGMLPTRLSEVVHEVVGWLNQPATRVGIHAHDDTACAVANSLAAVQAGATHVQGTANGYGERAGNADLFSIVAGLQLKLDLPVLPDGAITELVRVSHAIAELANIAPDDHQPWVGASAFAHKAGLHASALKVDPDLYQHIDPAAVGNDMRILVSELAGRASVELKARELDIEVDREVVGRVIERVKKLEAEGYSFEAAEASFELMLREEVDGKRARPFELESYRVISYSRGQGVEASEATVKIRVGEERIVAIGEGTAIDQTDAHRAEIIGADGGFDDEIAARRCAAAVERQVAAHRHPAERQPVHDAGGFDVRQRGNGGERVVMEALGVRGRAIARLGQIDRRGDDVRRIESGVDA